MSNNEEEKQVPEVEAAFTALLTKFGVGTKGAVSTDTIAENLSRTGGEFVFEEPQRLAERLASWHEHISPVKRKQILEQWFAEKGVEIPEEAIKVVSIKSSDIKRMEEEGTRKGEKYSVDTETGAVKVATTTDKNPLTWDEAEQLSQKIKKDLEEGGKGAEETPFIVNAEGAWQLNPKAKIGGMELLAFEAVKRSKERGEQPDPFEIMKERAQDIEVMRSVFGGGKEGTSLLGGVEDLLKLKTLLGTDEATKTMIAGIYKRLEDGEGKGESEEVKGLREDVKGLRDQLEQKEREKLTNLIDNLTKTVTNMRQELTASRAAAGAMNEYGIMDKVLGVVDKRLGAFESTIQAVFGRPPSPLSAKEKSDLTQAIGAEAEVEKQVDDLAQEVFYKHS